MTEPTPDARRISPAEGRRVRHPNGAVLEPKTTVTWSPFWERRLSDGDIDVLAAPAPKSDEKKDA